MELITKLLWKMHDKGVRKSMYMTMIEVHLKGIWVCGQCIQIHSISRLLMIPSDTLCLSFDSEARRRGV